MTGNSVVADILSETMHPLESLFEFAYDGQTRQLDAMVCFESGRRRLALVAAGLAYRRTGAALALAKPVLVRPASSAGAEPGRVGVRPGRHRCRADMAQAEQLVELAAKFVIHEAIDDWVEAAVRHRKPMKGEIAAHINVVARRVQLDHALARKEQEK